MKCWQGLSFFAASRRVSLCNEPSFIAHEKFRTEFFLTDTFLRYFEKHIGKYRKMNWKYRGSFVTTTCIQALSCFYSACLFSHSKHVLFSLTHWYFLVRTFFSTKNVILRFNLFSMKLLLHSGKQHLFENSGGRISESKLCMAAVYVCFAELPEMTI